MFVGRQVCCTTAYPLLSTRQAVCDVYTPARSYCKVQLLGCSLSVAAALFSYTQQNCSLDTS